MTGRSDPSLSSLVHGIRSWLPTGGSLPEAEWKHRHRALLAILWLNAAALPAYGAIAGYGFGHTLEHSASVVIFAALACVQRLSPAARSVLVSLGLLTAAALLVHITGGLIEAHFYFFVLIVALTLYESWLPFLVAVAFVLVHHGLLGTLVPEEVYNRPQAWDDPWFWAAIHAFFVALAGIAGIVAWRLNERVRSQMRAAQHELAVLSETDSLTKLGNRRKAMSDLAALLEGDPGLGAIALFDLDGFKSYNDAFGHPAGDALLTRLGGRLAEAIGSRGTVYRLGGDEFLVIAAGRGADRRELEEAGLVALADHGKAFVVGASCGSVSVPVEARTVSAAMLLADQRMYARKYSSRTSAMSQSKDVLLQALAERHPDLSHHLSEVRELVGPLGRGLGMADHEVDVLCHAAELHDVGKVAIPDAILEKPGALDDDELEFIRRHTLIGQRIVGVAPALAGVGELIRSSHERWDGEGYPDRLAGSEIPLGARVISVCDAYDAMTSDRAYRPAMPSASALAELRRCAGSQFDPDVVAVFAEQIEARGKVAAVA